MADQAINALSTKTTPETSDQLLLVGAGEPQLINYDKLADSILNKITSKNYALDAGQMTLLAALNKLNSENTYLSSDFSAGRIRKFGRVCCALINNGNFTSDGHASFTIPENFCPAINTDFVDTYSKIRFSIEDDGTIIQKDTPYSTEPIRGYFTYMSTSN